MAQNNVAIALVSAECETAIRDETDTTEMLRKSLKAARRHWMILDEDPQLKGALNAVLKKMGDSHPDRDRLETEIRMLSQFSAFLSAAQAGLAVEPPSLPEGFEALGVMKLWHEAK